MVDCLPLSIYTNVHRSHHDRMQDVLNRGHTFRQWPLTHITGRQLAEAGFFYLNTGDSVECAFCGVQVARWEEGDDPIIEHWKWSPTCPFLSTLKANSVNYTDTIKSKEEIGRPDLSEYTIRLKTFEDWPPGIKQTPEQLCNAGFYYTGIGDKVICFSCGVGAHAWEEGDEPMKEHAKMSPKCKYLIEIVGTAYIEEANLATDSSQEVMSDSAAAEENKQIYIEDLKRSISESDSEIICKICYDNPRSIILLPCHHMSTCLECSTKLDKCPICREPFESVIKAILE